MIIRFRISASQSSIVVVTIFLLFALAGCMKTISPSPTENGLSQETDMALQQFQTSAGADVVPTKTTPEITPVIFLEGESTPNMLSSPILPANEENISIQKNLSTITATPYDFQPTASLEYVSELLDEETVATPAYIGVPLDEDAAIIGENNLDQITRLAQWGRGQILAAVFAPDGNTVMVGSAHGIALYDIENLSSPPNWVPFQLPVFYQHMIVDKTGRYLRLERRAYDANLNFDYDLWQREFVSNLQGITWLRQADVNPDSGNWDVAVLSPDSDYGFRGKLTYLTAEEMETSQNSGPIYNRSEEGTQREVYNVASGEVLFELEDELPYVHLQDRSKPEGCNINYFSPCGNALMAIAMPPDQAVYSPDGTQFAVRYRPYYSSGPPRFSILRTYSAKNGVLIGQAGSFDHPVGDFAYSPDGRTLLVTYIDGTIHLFNTLNMEPTFDAWHFNAPIEWLQYGTSGRFMLVKRPKIFEIRLSQDGNLVSRHRSEAAAVSPVDDLFAIADTDGLIYLKRMQDGQTIQQLEGHQGEIYSLEFSPDGRYLVSSSQDCTIRRWDVSSGEFINFFEAFEAHPYEDDWGSHIFIYHTAFIPNSNLMIGFGSWSTAVVWNMFSGALQIAVEPEALKYYNGMITLDPHFPEYFILDDKNERFFIGETAYNLQSGEPMDQEIIPEIVPPTGCALPGPITPDGNVSFSVGYDDREGQICALSSSGEELLGSIEVFPPAAAENDIVWWLDLSPNGRQLAAYTAHGIIYIFQIVQ